MLVKTTDKMEAVEAFMNTWLKDKTKYCNYCGLSFNPKDTDEQGKWVPCCEKPEIGTNWDVTKRIIDENKEIRKTRLNKFASNEKKNFRMKTRIPPKLYQDLKHYFEKQYNEKIFKDKKEMNRFARKFKVFTIPEKI